MTTGIYLLTFADETTYIGKSINIEKRWEQHMESFLKGTAAKPMQRAYSYFGEPDKEIIIECSQDHLDVLEAHFIARCKPDLNTQQMKDPFEEIDDILEYKEVFLMSTLEHISKIGELLGECNNKDDEIKGLYADLEQHKRIIEELIVARLDEEIQKDIAKRIQRSVDSMEQFRMRAIKAEDALCVYLALPWWKRIFAK